MTKNGFIWIGPTFQAMRKMGDKIESKKLAKGAKVNVIPGKLADVSGIDEVLQLGKAVFFESTLIYFFLFFQNKHMKLVIQ